MLSILIPTYNTSVYELVKHLHNEATLLGIDFEICVGDDASTQYRDENNQVTALKNCSLCRAEQNNGRTYQRKLLANKANYNLLLFLDADVMPTTANFLANYLNKQPTLNEVVFGGYHYRASHERNQSLRHRFGRQREYATVENRIQKPYKYIFSGNLFIQKQTYLQLAIPTANQYGMDILFANALQQQNIKAIHINNTVDHLGLETNEVFLNKALQAVTLRYTHRHSINTPFEDSFQRLRKYKADRLFSKSIQWLSPIFRKNLFSRKPNMLMFDLYRLGYYCTLHQEESKH